MDTVTTAETLIRQGHSCSQAMLAAFAPRYGLPAEFAIKLATPFGGGMARHAEMCGAVTGALLVLGLHAGGAVGTDLAAKERTYALVHEFMLQFEQRRGSLNCRELLGFDLGNPEELRRAREQGLFTSLCPLLVRDAAEITAVLLQ